MSSDTLLVTGASGHLGRLVLESLLSGKGSNRKIIATTAIPRNWPTSQNAVLTFAWPISQNRKRWPEPSKAPLACF